MPHAVQPLSTSPGQATFGYDREAAVVVGGDVRETQGGAIPSSAPLLMPTQEDQTGFLFSMKALIPSCPSCRPRLSTMVWEAR